MAPAAGYDAAARASRPQHQETGTPQSRFLLLPLELRLICYEHAFSHPSSSLGCNSERLSLLLACSQIYNEARCLAYALTHFNIPFTLISEMPSRLRRLRGDQISCIRSLIVTIDTLEWLRIKKTHDYFLPRLDSDGLPRLHLDSLRIHLDSAEQSPNYIRPTCLEMYMQWKRYYFETASSWMDTVSARESLQNSFSGLCAQWLDTLHFKMLLISEEPVNAYFSIGSILQDLIEDNMTSVKNWNLQANTGDVALVMTRLER